MGWKKFQFRGERWPFLPFKRGVKEDDDSTIKQDEPREWALMRPTHRAKRPPNARYIAPIKRRGLSKTRSPRMKYLRRKRGKSIYNNVRAREKKNQAKHREGWIPCDKAGWEKRKKQGIESRLSRHYLLSRSENKEGVLHAVTPYLRINLKEARSGFCLFDRHSYMTVLVIKKLYIGYIRINIDLYISEMPYNGPLDVDGVISFREFAFLDLT